MEASSVSTEGTDGARQTDRAGPFVVMEVGQVPLARLLKPWETADYGRLNRLLVHDRKAVRITYSGTADEFQQWLQCIAQQVGFQNFSLVTDRADKAIYLTPRGALPGLERERMLADWYE